MADHGQALLQKLRQLKTDRSRGDPAPQKPSLLLAVMDMTESGRLSSPVVPLSAKLTYQFLTYWHIVAHRRKAPPDIRVPFHHLSGDDIWEALVKSVPGAIDFMDWTEIGPWAWEVLQFVKKQHLIPHRTKWPN